MGLDKKTLSTAADFLYAGEQSRLPVEPLTTTYAGMDLEDAYGIQLINADRAIAEGRELVGYKVGLTGKAIQKQLGVFEPDFGHLFSDMAVGDEGEIPWGELIQPKIEGEIAFLLGQDIESTEPSIQEVIGAVEFAVSCLEIVDSRIRDWKIKGPDTVADNGSSARFVLGKKRLPLANLGLSTLGMALYRNDEVFNTGSGAAVMGNPLNPVVFLARELGKRGRKLKAGEVVLSGALSGLVTVEPGDEFRCEIAELGPVSVRFGRKI